MTLLPAFGQNAGHEPPELTLRDFLFDLTMIYGPEGPTGLRVRINAPGLAHRLSILFDRSEFVNLATAGLHALEVADGDTYGNGKGVNT